jgi:hypothetical protein
MTCGGIEVGMDRKVVATNVRHHVRGNSPPLAADPEPAKTDSLSKRPEADHLALDPDLPHRSIAPRADCATIDTIAPTNPLTAALGVR